MVGGHDTVKRKLVFSHTEVAVARLLYKVG